jgi:hypothetical protein
MLSLCFKARRLFSMMKRHHSHHFQRIEGENSAAAVSKVQATIIQNKKDDTDHGKQKTKLTGMQNLKIQKIQKFNFNAHAYIN